MGIFKVKGSPFYQFAFSFKGDRYRGSTGFEKKADAEIYYANERRKIRLGETDPNTLTLVEAFNRYEEEHAMFLASYNRVEDHVNHLLGYFGNGKLLHDVTQNELEKYIAHCRTEIYRRKVYSPTREKMIEVGKPAKVSNATINRRIATFQGMHTKAWKSWKVKVEQIDFPALKLKERALTNNTLDRSDPQKLWDAAPEHLKHFIMVSLYTGWRKTTVLQLNGKAQIDLSNMTIKTIGKGNKPIVTIITDSFAKYITANNLHEMDLVCAYKGLIVKDIKTAWKTLFKNTGIKPIRIHDLRHTFGTWLYEQTGDQRLVQEMLNHSDIKTSMRYTHTKRELQREQLNKAVAFEVNQVKAIK